MYKPRRVLINATRRKKPLPRVSEQTSSLNDVWQTSECSTVGVVISYRQGIGEVLIGDSFKDPKTHFIFNSKTKIKTNKESEYLNVGSNVQISWSKNLKAAVEGRHSVVQIDIMRVFKCTRIIQDQIQLIYNSQSVLGVSLGLTETYHEVAFHPSCSPKVSFETFKAAANGLSEFDVLLNSKNNTEVTLKVDAKILVAPFLINASGSAGKCRRIVIDQRKIADFEDYAVVTEVVPNMFIEARYFANFESVYCSMKACHSNVIRRITVGTIVYVKASPTFRSCLYQWYGYDVTIAHPKDPIKVPKQSEARKLLKRSYKADGTTKTVINSEKREESAMKDIVLLNSEASEGKVEERVVEVQQNVKKKSYKDQLPLNTVGRKLRFRYHLLGDCKMNLDPHEVKRTLKSYKMKEEAEDFPISRKSYGYEVKKEVESVVASFNLLKTVDNSFSRRDPFPLPVEEEKIENHSKSKEISFSKAVTTPKFEKIPLEEILEKLADKDGFEKSSKLTPKFVFPDTKWQPKEMRIIGIHDDLQWIMMETFSKTKEELENMMEKDPEVLKKEPLNDGWWYRRSVPRTEPVKLVTQLNTRRNIRKDCTEEVEF